LSFNPPPRAEGSPLLRYKRPLAHYTGSCLPFWKLLFRRRPEKAPCRGDMGPTDYRSYKSQFLEVFDISAFLLLDTRITSVKLILYILVVEFLYGRHVSTSSRSSSGPNLRIQILHKLTHKMQAGIPVAYNIC
jgi:hypothetical protein